MSGSLFDFLLFVQDGLSEVLKSRVLGNVSSKSRGASSKDENDVDESFFNSSTPSMSAFGSCISTKRVVIVASKDDGTHPRVWIFERRWRRNFNRTQSFSRCKRFDDNFL